MATLQLNQKTYQIAQEKIDEFLEVAQELAGKNKVYAVRKGDYYELRNEVASPLTVLEYEADGWEALTT